ncbi:MAG: ATP-dependent DNA helicase RecG, partial [Candidatus Jacksonbacteria bacterium]|nr:ATP-dependent DNA helicase RecG [Candidatus Jacksonbacteria bacterium]
TLSTPIKTLTRVGESAAWRLKKLCLTTVGDLLFYYPSRYEDYSAIVAIRDLRPETVCTVQGEVASISNKITPRKRQKITELFVSDGTGSIKAVWFNQPYLATQIKEGDKVSLAGKVEYTGFGLEMRGPEWEKETITNYKLSPRSGIPFAGRITNDELRTRNNKSTEGIHTGRMIPVYPLTAGVTNRQMRFLVSQALGAVGEVEEWMDENYELPITNYQLLGIQDAIKNIHYPESKELLAKARLRLKFEELFFLQLRKAITRREVQSAKASSIQFKEDAIKKFVQSLPFELTNAQRKAAWQIIKDCGRETPMNRLLQGDVGSGKTIVSLIAMLNTALQGYQAVLMAPTEILAKQHFQSVCRFLEEWNEIEIALWTRSQKELRITNYELPIKDDELRIKDTKTKDRNSKLVILNSSIVIGTHALIQEDIQFRNLALAIVDEQHRFGVEQRKALREKASPLLTKEGQGEVQSPHFLSMTATPIPRSLSLTAYGDLDISIIDEMPLGRKAVITKVVSTSDSQKAYQFIQKQIDEGRQVFVICPLIDESDFLGVKAVTTEFEKLDKKIFPHIPVGLLHGKLKDKEKDEMQEKFLKGECKILVATSVVEVGVDVPNASVMMIEGAERFGLAQLHQFRGRVGRAEHQSYCFLFTDSPSHTVYERLDFLTRETDGFKIAEYDLQLRGAGNMYGTEQHGIPEFKIASFQDYKLIELTQTLARDIIEKDPMLVSFGKLREKLEQEGGAVHLE